MSSSGKSLIRTREDLAAQRLDVAPPGAQAPDPQLTSVIRLRITDVMVYERNPRRASHERIAELKESIRANGIEQIVTVTRRPGETRYVVAKGGNSRVTAATALYDETGDERFLHYDFVYVPYPGEARLLAAHLRENDQRADLCFWDKANGYLALKADLETERGATLSLREFSRLLEQDGAAVSHVLLSLFQFAIERLSALGPATAFLSRRALVDVIQPGIGMLLRLARRLGLDDQWVQARVIDPHLTGMAAGCEPGDAGMLPQRAAFDAARLVDGLRQRMVDELGVSRDALGRMCHLLERTPDATSDDLREVGGMQVERAEPSPAAPAGDVTGGADTPMAPMQGVGDLSVRARAMEATVPDATPGAKRPGESATTPDSPQRTPADGSTRVVADVHDPGEDAAACASDEGELFREAVVAFARTCGLDGCVRDAPALPYGFMIEPPPPGQPRLSPETDAGHDEGALNRYLGWWWLVSLSRQNTATGIARIPRDTLFARMAGDDEAWNRACDASIGEPLLGDRMDVMFDVMLNPDHPIGQWWAELVLQARAFRVANSERFASARWPEPGADERLQRGGL
ncbi:ParB family protein [Paraburkholderia diazotrophica]|uniref:ParB family protein n=1 Tax=Paraburkholderia diazotrophica TaxID=667676 RepID=UPI00317B2F3C